MKLPHTEVKFYPEVKSQTGLSSLRVSCKRALKLFFQDRHVSLIQYYFIIRYYLRDLREKRY